MRDRVGRVEKSSGAGKRRNAREAHMITDPYRSLVGAMSSEDIPLVVKGGEELPTGGGELDPVPMMSRSGPT